MPKLLQINATANWGSTGRIAEQIGKAAMARGWESYIAYGRMCSASASILIKIGSFVDVVFHCLKARIFDASGLGSYIATRRLVRQIRKINPDVIQLHNIHGYFLNYRLLFKYLNICNIPVVWTFHDLWALTGHCAHFVEAKCDKWKSDCYDCPLYRRYPAALIDYSQRNYRLKKSLFSNYDKLNIVSISRWGDECVKASYLSDTPSYIIPNGIDLNVFTEVTDYKQSINVESRFMMLGVASQWKEGKGLEDYLKLSRLLNEDEVIVLVGLTKMQIDSLPTNIIGFERMESHEELVQMYSRADVLLSLSYAETFGLTIVEAAACGTPAVVYDNTAQTSLVSEETGAAVTTGDILSVYSAVQEVKRKGKGYYKAACRARAEKYFDKDKCFEKYIDLYESLLSPEK